MFEEEKMGIEASLRTQAPLRGRPSSPLLLGNSLPAAEHSQDVSNQLKSWQGTQTTSLGHRQ